MRIAWSHFIDAMPISAKSRLQAWYAMSKRDIQIQAICKIWSGAESILVQGAEQWALYLKRIFLDGGWSSQWCPQWKCSGSFQVKSFLDAVPTMSFQYEALFLKQQWFEQSDASTWHSLFNCHLFQLQFCPVSWFSRHGHSHAFAIILVINVFCYTSKHFKFAKSSSQKRSLAIWVQPQGGGVNGYPSFTSAFAKNAVLEKAWQAGGWFDMPDVLWCIPMWQCASEAISLEYTQLQAAFTFWRILQRKSHVEDLQWQGKRMDMAKYIFHLLALCWTLTWRSAARSCCD